MLDTSIPKFSLKYEERPMKYYLQLYEKKKYRVFCSRWEVGFLRLRKDSHFIIEIDVDTYYRIVYELFDGLIIELNPENS